MMHENERMLELEVEATAYADSKVPANNRYNDIYYAIVRRKFAELIVRECLSICDDEKSGYNKCRKDTLDFDEKNIYAEGEISANTIKFKIKEHFGVEE